MAYSTNFELTNSERAQLRKGLLQAGIKTRGMTDAQIAEAYDGLNQPAPKPKRARSSKSNGHNGSGKLNALQSALKDVIGDIPAQLDEQQVINLIKQHAPATKETYVNHIVTIERTDNPPVTIEGAHPVLSKIIDVLSIEENVYLVGGAGSGKTTLAKQAAEALNTDCYTTGKVSDEYALIGFVDGAGTYHRTPLRDAIEYGGVFLFDEIDASNPNALTKFNALLENKTFTFPDNQTLTIDPSKTFFIAAANTVGTGANRSYVGRYEQDRAFLDRFIQLEVNYDSTIERNMALNAWFKAGGTEEHQQNALDWLSIIKQTRKTLEDNRILALITPRATRHGSALLAKGWALTDVKEAVLYKHLSHDQRAQLGV